MINKLKSFYFYITIPSVFLLFATRSYSQELSNIRTGNSLKTQFDDSTLSSHQFVKNILDTAIKLYKTTPDKAAPLFQELFPIALRNQFYQEATNAYSYLLTIWDKKGMYAEADSFVNTVLQLAQEKKLTKLFPAVYNSLGNRFQRKGVYDSALHYYYKAINIAEQDSLIPPNVIPTLYTNLSGILSYTGDYEKSLDYLEKAERDAQQSDNLNIQILILVNKSGVLKNLHRGQEAIAVVKQAIVLAQKDNHTQWEHLALTNLGDIYSSLKDYSQALFYLEKAYKLEGDVDPNYRNTNTVSLANIQLTLKNYDKAEYFALQALHSAGELRISRSILESHRILGEVYTATQQFEKSAFHYKQYALIKDTVLNEDMLLRNSQLESKYRLTQKDKELAENKLEIAHKQNQLKDRNLWISIFAIGFLLLVALAALLYSRYRNIQSQKKIQEEKLKNMMAEQEAAELKAMIQGEEVTRIQIARDLHDGIGGLLTSVKMKINTIKNKNQDVELQPEMNKLLDMVTETTQEIRKSAHNLMPDVLVRQSLKEALLLYCENNRTQELHLDLQYDNTLILPKNAELLLYRIIQELVQNIIKHANANHAVIQIMKNENQISITVEDNGSGFNTDLETNKGAGLKNIQSRVNALNGYFSISSSQNMGTTIHIEINNTKLQNLSNNRS